ncbi:MAG: DNA polymerase Y family protein [Candidatus Levyibacteriota bacterium]
MVFNPFNLAINGSDPRILHVDLNSCFATLEQQSSPLQRGKPLVVAAYDSPGGCVVAPSIEAKKLGIKTGMSVRDARILCPSVIVRTPHPTIYRDAHMRFKKIFMDYTPDVTPKSIDEAVLDFTRINNHVLFKKSLIDIGFEIKKRIREEIGEWVSCNVGIGTNRFLAKTAAGLHKPDGLDSITHTNIERIYSKLSLLDLCGINTRYQARLNIAGIYTPTQFLNADLQTLKKRVFKSICGYYWYLRIRGWEVDAVDFKRKSYGQSYALGKKSDDPQYLSSLLMKLTEKMARRLRKALKTAKGIHVACAYIDGSYWHKGKTFEEEMFTTDELFKKVILVFNSQPQRKVVTKLEINCFHLQEATSMQESLFETEREKKRNMSVALDKINDKWGEWSIYHASMMGREKEVIDRIAFGGVKELEEVYAL